jgi:thymidylate synthase (FAD)
MTKQIDVTGDERYTPVLDHGFCGIIDVMGTDAAIVQAARVSYGAGTKTVNEDRGLIRYLLRHSHTTPFEMCDIKFHVKMPIFVARQWHRHRTASINEESARYSEMTDDFYYPINEDIQPQSKDNKQGRNGELEAKDIEGVQWVLGAAYEHSYNAYKTLLGENIPDFYDLRDTDANSDGLLTKDFPGIARELARVVMPVAAYTEFYWKVNLHNLFHFLKLRADAHAQKEIRVFAEAIIDLAKKHFPVAFEAWEDYSKNALLISRMEVETIRLLLSDNDAKEQFLRDSEKAKTEKAFAKGFAMEHGMNVREMDDFVKRFFA